MPSRGCEELLGIENLSLSVVLITDAFDFNEEIKAHEVEEYNLLDWSVQAEVKDTIIHFNR